MITNETFWHYWRDGNFKAALECSIEKKEKKRGNLFRSKVTETTVIATISAGEFLYDYCMINPTAVKGIDFARSEDLSNLLALSNFASTIDTANLTGNMAQLQGYVAERMIAQQLTAAGHDVEFPETSNQVGWDMLVDGERFQVKCGASNAIVEQHFAKYPDIPVYVNQELANMYENNPLVYSTAVTREEVIKTTQQTLVHADNLTDFEIPWITFGVSSLTNAKRMYKDGIKLRTATRNVAFDTASRATTAAIGKVALGLVGNVVLPGAGGIVFPIVGTYIGMKQGGKLSLNMKKMFAKKEHAAFSLALQHLIEKMQRVLQYKEQTKMHKYDALQEQFSEKVNDAFSTYHKEDMTSLHNVKNQLELIEPMISKDPFQAFERLMTVLGTAGIHEHALADELMSVEQTLVAYSRKL